MSSYWKTYPVLEKQIAQVKNLIEQRVQVRNPEISQAVAQLALAGGKYLRPAFFFLFTNFGPNQDEDRLTKIAASLEILHMATLIHDDIIDDSPLRRGTVSIQAKFGKDIAVYTGDLLFTIFFDLTLETMNGSHYMQINAAAMKKILLGELDQMQLRYNQTQSIHDYLRSTSGKTAELFRLASLEGAYFSGASPEVVRRAGRIGLNIGLAFQMLDDILDYSANQADFNKPVIEDLNTGVYTLPLLLALKKEPAAFKPYLDKQNQMELADMQAVANLVRTLGGVDAAREVARKFTHKALVDIEGLPKSQTKRQLTKLTNHLLKRKI